MAPDFHVFLSHNSKDKPAVREIAAALRANGLRPWLDEDELIPGRLWQDALEEIIATCATAAVFVGPSGFGPWQEPEMRACLSEFISRQLPVLPVLLPGAPETPLPIFLRAFTWVDLRHGLSGGAWDRLIWGITGTKPAEEIAALPVDDIPKPGPLPEGSRMPLSVNPLFVGREDDLRTLARQLKAGETSAIGQVEIAGVTGIGGIGKTQLASEFVHRYGRYFGGGVFWMSFADPAAVPAEVAACGQSLNLHPSYDSLPLDQQVRLVEEDWKRPVPRLLVFDNCEDEQLLDRWRPKTGGARVLVTSRRSRWDRALGVQSLSITTLPRVASIELLRRFRAEIPVDEPALNGIAAELGDLPLALHLAGSFLERYGRSSFGQPAAYLDSLRRGNLLDHPSLQGKFSGLSPTKHEVHVGRTFALSVERLNPEDAADELARLFLARAAYFAPGEPIPREFLLKTVSLEDDAETPFRAEDSLGRLTALGLLEQGEDGTLLMHRLVGELARGLGVGEEARDAVEETVYDEVNRLNKIGLPSALLKWRPHLRAVTDKAKDREDPGAAKLCSALGYHLGAIGSLAGARVYSERALAIREKILGSEHPDTAISLNNVGYFLRSQGDLSGARPYYERALAILKKALGPEHPDTVIGLNNLGFLLLSQGDLAGARPFYEQALVIRKMALGSEHPETARSLNNFGDLLREEGNLAGAHQYFERALAILEKVLGSEHPETARSLNNLGFLLGSRGDIDEAHRCYEQALAINEAQLGPDHPDTATVLNNLGSLLESQGDLAEARSYYERALAIRGKVLGPDHPDTAISLNNLGLLLEHQGVLAEVLPYFERVLAILNDRLGPEHPDTKTVRENLEALTPKPP
jgi:tetratricopeptide (TPR) repeat protein